MNEREKIFARIREALTELAPVPGHGHVSTAGSMLPATGDVRGWLPRVSGSDQERLDAFAKASTDLKADFRLVQGEQEMVQALIAMRDKEGWKKIGSHAGRLTNLATSAMQIHVCCTDQ